MLKIAVLSLLAATAAGSELTADSAPPLTNGTNHLYFYWKNAGYFRCGDVDAAPRMPAALFEPENKDALQAYINATIELYHITDGNPSHPDKVQLEQGTCKENGYGNLLPGCPRKDPKCASPNPITAEWAPKDMMKVICDLQCKCKYPNCKDVPDPSTGARFAAPSTTPPSMSPYMGHLADDLGMLR
jgi:hypothetical protein